MATSPGNNRCKGCGEYPGIHRRDWCIDCDRKRNKKPVKTCTWPTGPDEVCGKEFEGHRSGTRCVEHKHHTSQDRKRVLKSFGIIKPKSNNEFVKNAEKKISKRETNLAVGIRIPVELIERIDVEIERQNVGIIMTPSKMSRSTFIKYAIERTLKDYEEQRQGLVGVSNVTINSQ